MRALLVLAVLALNGCVVVNANVMLNSAAQKPGVRIGVAIGAALVAGYVVQHEHDGGSPAAPLPPPRPPPPFNPCAGSNLCAK
jgi:hypothetical protein